MLEGRGSWAGPAVNRKPSRRWRMELHVDVLGARGFHRLPSNSGISVQCNFHGQLLETLPSVPRKGSGDPVWRAGGRLVWSLSTQDVVRVKALSPTLKLHVLARPKAASATPKPLGFALLDVRAAEQSLAQPTQRTDSWYPVHSSGSGVESGGELHVSLRFVAVRGGGGSGRSTSGGSSVPLSPLEGEAAASPHSSGPLPGAVEATEAASIAAAAPDALRTALRVGGSSDPGPPLPAGEDADFIPIGTRGSEPGSRAYTLSVSLAGVQRLGALLALARAASAPPPDRGTAAAAAAGAPPPLQQLWLSYKLFGVVVQTDSFPAAPPTAAPGSGEQPDGFPLFPPISDSFALRSCVPDLAAFFSGAPPLQVRGAPERACVYLCPAHAHGAPPPPSARRRSSCARTAWPSQWPRCRSLCCWGASLHPPRPGLRARAGARPASTASSRRPFTARRRRGPLRCAPSGPPRPPLPTHRPTP